MTTQKISLTAIIPQEQAEKRLDIAVSLLFPQYSRARLQNWIKNGELKVDDKILRQRDKVKAGQKISIAANIEDESADLPENLPLNIIYEDQDLIVINKPEGQVVHPACGNRKHTLLNALLYYAPELKKVPRAGIIHRLDKDTSGLLVIARNLKAHTKLVKVLKKREIEREYLAIVSGALLSGGVIAAPIGRHRTQRTKMAVTTSGKPAITHYRILERFPAHTYLKINLETGRTHQIRVHLAHLNYPIVGDKTYAGRLKLPKGASEELKTALINFPRQALHATRLTFSHPESNKKMTFNAPLPKDMQQLLKILRFSC